MTDQFDYEGASDSELRRELESVEKALEDEPSTEYSRQGLLDHRDRLREELQSRGMYL